MTMRVESQAEVERDIAAVAEYWGKRRLGWLDRAAEEFDALVAPFTYYDLDASNEEIQAVNRYFTEWFLFERPLRGGLTPLELYIDQCSSDADRARLARLRQVADTQLFARFAILQKDRSKNRIALRDMATGSVYSVHDPLACNQERWQDGTLAQRIACVDGVWHVVGQARLYDAAASDGVGPDGPGTMRSEDAGRVPSTVAMSPYVRLLRDVIGIDGRYTSTFRLRAVG